MFKKSLLINRQQLISLVRQRPAIWDKTMKIYKCKRAKTEAWRDICVALNKHYDRMESKQRKEYFKQLIRIWTHIRDNWMKSMKDQRNKKELTKPYIYHEQLLFLKKILEPGQCENTENDETEHENSAEEEKDPEKPGTSGFSTETVEDDNQIEIWKKGSAINRIKLINLVRERPVIWDKTTDGYKNKHAKTAAWRDICFTMDKYYEQMNHTRRTEYFKLLVSIWTQIRDTWMRSVKNKTSRPYKHHKKLLFLKKIITSADILQNIENMGDNEPDTAADDENESVGTSCSSRRQRIDEEDHECTYFVDSHKNNTLSQTETEDRNYSFFKSIQPTLAFFNDDQILQFQAGTISLLQRIKTEQQTVPSNRASRDSEDAPSPFKQDLIKIEKYDLT